MRQHRRHSFDTWQRGAGLATTVLLMGLVAGCGGSDDGPSRSSDANVGGVREPELTPETTCQDFLAAENSERDQALRRLAGELSIPDAVTDAGATQVDYVCAQDPELTLGAAVISLDPPPDAHAPTGAESPEGPWPVANEAARDAAVDGIEAYLSYRWDTLEDDEAEARSLSTAPYWAESADLWDVLAKNVPEQKAVSEIEVRASGVVFQDETLGVYLVALDQKTHTDGNQVSNYDQSVLVSVVADSDNPDDEDPSEWVWLLDDVQMKPTSVSPADDGPAGVAAQFVSAMSTYGAQSLRGGRLPGMEEDVAAVTTEEFFTDFLNQTDTISSLIEGGESSEFSMTAAAVVEVADETASVLVGGSRIVSYGGEEGETTALRLLVDLELVDGDWLASDFTPVA